MDKDFQEKLKKAFIDIAKSKEGHKIISEVIHMKDTQKRKIQISTL